MRSYFGLTLLFGLIALYAEDRTTGMATAAPAVAPAPRQFLIVLRLVPRLHDTKAWTKSDLDAVGDHFNRLKAATDAGQVLLAGRTNEPGEKTFGLIVFTAADEAAARAFMAADPCVAAGVMTAELHPYTVALRAH